MSEVNYSHNLTYRPGTIDSDTHTHTKYINDIALTCRYDNDPWAKDVALLSIVLCRVHVVGVVGQVSRI